MNETNDENRNQNIIQFILNGKELIDGEVVDEQLLSEYVSQLSSIGVNNLTLEPQRLSDLRSNVIEKTQHLAFNNYNTFITNAECAHNVITDFNSIEDDLNFVIETVPHFMKKCDSFSKDAKSISKRWREVSLMLSKHPQILEVLEIPQLMDTCVRNNYYEEALQLYAYVQKLNRRYGKSIPVISCIANDVDLLRETMMNQLLKELNSNIQLPACLKVIGYLRRMDQFSEAELRIKFLTARDSWLQSIIKEIAANNPLVHITKVIETNRVNLFDIVTQYRAIFADHEPIVSSTARYFGVSSNLSVNRDFTDSAIINSWLLFKVNQFLHILNHDLNRCVDNEFNHYYPIESILEPCFYFGLSMSRIGADFRPQLIPIINDAIYKRFSRVVNEGTTKFETSIQSFTLTLQSVNQSVGLPVGGDEVEYDLQPPTCLLELPLLANYCNHMLTAMNEIRQTSPIALFIQFESALSQSFERVSDAICRYFKAEESGLAAKEREILYKFCDLYVSEVLPHLNKCFQRICPLSSIANKLGVSLIELNKDQHHYKPNLNIQCFADPVLDLIRKSKAERTPQESVGLMASNESSHSNESLLDSKRFKSETN